MDGFLNNMNMILWPRFQSLIDAHITSLKTAVVSKLLPTKEPHPHYILRRYTELCVSILILNDGYNDALLVHSLSRLRTEVLNLVGRMAAEFPGKKQMLIFWINNIDLVTSILNVYELTRNMHRMCLSRKRAIGRACLQKSRMHSLTRS
jgi:hypothetical protein